ncbi:alanyl-tRNA editing protein [Neptunomonas antarctica]|uniref:Alanine--tRNA ligase n=1 Tax=Neptunomonas antarctica TaxID=619304 RepID=A0A1N7P498_9GAMM|nr:alanyl-tRNA editing protein [Neptunomonas antarctica]SIT05366.1 Ala-tRNA(Pro) hydrolase [Neptunomonas antarctica]
MTTALFNLDSYQTQATAVVTAITENHLELDQTLFYPQGGGQPGDQGWITTSSARLEVIDTIKGETPNSILHCIKGDTQQLYVGDSILMEIDWPRRYQLMRMHSCLHLLCSLIPKGVTGGSVGLEKSRLDFDLGEAKLDKELLTQQLNLLIQTAASVTTLAISDAELTQQPELVRTLSVQPPRGTGSVRMVKIDGVDLQPCGGTHVANIKEIGIATISKIENKGRRNRRIHLLLEPQS